MVIVHQEGFLFFLDAFVVVAIIRGLDIIIGTFAKVHASASSNVFHIGGHGLGEF